MFKSTSCTAEMFSSLNQRVLASLKRIYCALSSPFSISPRSNICLNHLWLSLYPTIHQMPSHGWFKPVWTRPLSDRGLIKLGPSSLCNNKRVNRTLILLMILITIPTFYLGITGGLRTKCKYIHSSYIMHITSRSDLILTLSNDWSRYSWTESDYHDALDGMLLIISWSILRDTLCSLSLLRDRRVRSIFRLKLRWCWLWFAVDTVIFAMTLYDIIRTNSGYLSIIAESVAY